MIELTQGSRRKRRKSSHVEEVPKEAEKGPEQDSGTFSVCHMVLNLKTVELL